MHLHQVHPYRGGVVDLATQEIILIEELVENFRQRDDERCLDVDEKEPGSLNSHLTLSV